MFKPNDTIHFSCKQCGKCCQKSPHMHFYDMLELSDEFIFQTAHHGVLSFSKTPLEKSLLEHYQILGHTIMMPELEASLFYFIDFIPISYPSYKTCPKLIENQCSIYGKRPSSCKLAPFDARFDDTQQWRALQYFKDNTEKNDWKCSFDESSPIVYKEEQIYQPAQNSLYFQSVDLIRDITDKYIEFLGLASKQHQDEHFKALFQSIRQQNLMITDMVVILQVARYYNLISEEYAVTFMNNQIQLIEKEMKPALALKRKEDLQTSRLYKKQKEYYEKAIKDNLFKHSQEDFNLL